MSYCILIPVLRRHPSPARAALIGCVLASLVLLPNIRSVRAQTLTSEIIDFQQVSMRVELLGPAGEDEYLTLIGTANVEYVFEGASFGDADDDDANLLDEIEFFVHSLDLAGWNPTLGNIQITAVTAVTSGYGFMEEQDNVVPLLLDLPPFSPTGSVNCLLALDLQIEFPGQTLRTQPVHHVAGQLTHHPPSPLDYFDGSFDGLQDLNGNATGWYIRVDALRLNPLVHVDHYENAVMMLELSHLTNSRMVQMMGPVTTATIFSGSEPGSAGDDDGDGLDDVFTHITELSMHGVHPDFGPMDLHLGTHGQTSGFSEEISDLMAGNLDVEPFGQGDGVDSFFDVFFDVDLLGSQWQTRDPHRVSGLLHQLPALPADGLSGGAFVDLLSSGPSPTGYAIRVDHLRLNPPVEIDRFESVTATLRLIYPTAEQEIVALRGRAIVMTVFEGAVLGAASDNDLNGRDDVSTELLALELAGDCALGPIELALNTEVPSAGSIEELTDLQSWWLDLLPFSESPGADSFFDVFVTLDAGALSGVSAEGIFIEGRVAYKPAGPGDILHGSDAVDILDPTGQPTGHLIVLEQLQLGPISTSIDPGPPPLNRKVQLRVAPNPFNPLIRISLRAERAGLASLRVYDSRGRFVVGLYDGLLPPGESRLSWNGRDAEGRSVASGVYHLKLVTVDGTETRKVALVK